MKRSLPVTLASLVWAMTWLPLAVLSIHQGEPVLALPTVPGLLLSGAALATAWIDRGAPLRSARTRLVPLVLAWTIVPAMWLPPLVLGAVANGGRGLAMMVGAQMLLSAVTVGMLIAVWKTPARVGA